ncbi:bZIP transcription factor domain-containing protein [Ditylenchus destructor]|uniref:BZIP transcription factor domain-containing protein n=1 Tax=Ditylenchus destructor TaxID=166010 RepID=A0AAD4NFV4_9BILA|nr:bZIP transcription factor domain-containing protein [Ditylenchus destructor]
MEARLKPSCDKENPKVNPEADASQALNAGQGHLFGANVDLPIFGNYPNWPMQLFDSCTTTHDWNRSAFVGFGDAGIKSMAIKDNSSDQLPQVGLRLNMMMEQEDWPSVALIGKDDFLGYPSSSAIRCLSPQSLSPHADATPRSRASTMLDVVYESPKSPKGKVRNSFTGTLPNDHYGSDGISPSPSSHGSSSCSSLSQSDDQNSSRGNSFSGYSSAKQPIKVNINNNQPMQIQTSNSYTMTHNGYNNLRGADIIMGHFDGQQPMGSSPNFALTLSPTSYGNQQNGTMNLFPSPGSDYSMMPSSYNLTSFASPQIPLDYPQGQQRRQSVTTETQNNTRTTSVIESNKISNEQSKVVIKGEVPDQDSSDVLDFEARMQQYDDYSSYPDGEYYKALLDDDIASTTENEFNPYSSIDDKNYAFTSIDDVRNRSSSSSSSTATLNREMILHEKMMPMPPAKTRSKMHDLANIRGHGIIQLSPEEKRTLLQEGYTLPTRLPLTREEEEALKIARRKIKNKLSAQESRRKRKEYMDGLEKKVQAYFGDNVLLKNRVKQLETLNRDLVNQVKKLQSALTGQRKFDVIEGSDS